MHFNSWVTFDGVYSWKNRKGIHNFFVFPSNSLSLYSYCHPKNEAVFPVFLVNSNFSLVVSSVFLLIGLFRLNNATKGLKKL